MEATASIPNVSSKHGFSKLDLLLVFIPLSLIFSFAHLGGMYVFIFSIISIIPIAKHIGIATESIALRVTPALSALLNATFENAIELMIAIFALQRGLVDVVRASITGSIIANLLLLIGLSMLAGGLKYKEQKFNKDSAGISSTMLIIAIAGLSIPTVYAFVTNNGALQTLSLSVSVVMAAIYILSLVFTFVTHKHLFDVGDELRREKIKPTTTMRKSLIVLVVFVILAAIQSELLVSTIQSASSQIGLTEVFIGVVVIAILSNIAEKLNAITFALKDKVYLSIEIGTSSATQMALFVVPILTFVAILMGQPFNLVFPIFELATIILSVIIINYLSTD